MHNIVFTEILNSYPTNCPPSQNEIEITNQTLVNQSDLISAYENFLTISAGLFSFKLTINLQIL